MVLATNLNASHSEPNLLTMERSGEVRNPVRLRQDHSEQRTTITTGMKTIRRRPTCVRSRSAILWAYREPRNS